MKNKRTNHTNLLQAVDITVLYRSSVKSENSFIDSGNVKWLRNAILCNNVPDLTNTGNYMNFLDDSQYNGNLALY